MSLVSSWPSAGGSSTSDEPDDAALRGPAASLISPVVVCQTS
jgi:hypothetical protein